MDLGTHWITQLKRVKDAPCEIEMEGTKKALYGGGTYKFSAHLIIWAVRNLVNWCSPAVAELTDYPDMAESGDWSGVHDSCTEAKDEIFYRFVLCKVKLSTVKGKALPVLKSGKVKPEPDYDAIVASALTRPLSSIFVAPPQ